MDYEFLYHDIIEVYRPFYPSTIASLIEKHELMVADQPQIDFESLYLEVYDVVNTLAKK
jgi:hypothetical protein